MAMRERVVERGVRVWAVLRWGIGGRVGEGEI